MQGKVIQRFKNNIIPFYILIAGIWYYSLYYNYDFNIADEGSVTLITIKLLNGEIPFKDIILGYNLFWFYPIVFLFKIFGVNFLILKIYFMFLALLSGTISYLILTQITRKSYIAVLGSIIIILVPGTLHKTYIPLICIANIYFFLKITEGDPFRSTKKIILASIIISISLLVRVDLGIVCTLIIFSLLFLKIFFSEHDDKGRKISEKVILFIRYFLIIVFTICVIHLPFIIVAHSQQFLTDFLQQYLNKIILITKTLKRLNFLASTSSAKAVSDTYLSRVPIMALFFSEGKRLFSLLTYTPLLIFLITTIALVSKIFGRLKDFPSIFTNDTLKDCVLLFVPIAAFPQFFLFRPDLYHLSQFMPGFLILVFYKISKAIEAIQSETILDNKTPLLKAKKYSIPALLLLFIYVGIYVYYAMAHNGAGTVVLRKPGDKLFNGKNGVIVYMNKSLSTGFNHIMDVIEKYSDLDDYVLCYPYLPGINVISGRNTYQRRLYVDDATLIKQPNWLKKSIEEINQKKPAIIIYSDWAVNGTEISRFSNWAGKVKKHIDDGYHYYGQILGYNIYIRQKIFSAK
ncbi:hypothetical protein ACFLZL_00325 [Thermodesulfobacteriota bacterium]